MIVRAYGTRLEAVEPDFNPLAITTVSLRRTHTFSMPLEEFERTYERVGGHELATTADGPVQLEVERELLAELEKKLGEVDASLGEDELLLVENQRAVDLPRPHEKKQTLVVEGENRLYFHWWIDPPLRVGVYRKRS
jgi:hypothetical protein